MLMLPVLLAIVAPEPRITSFDANEDGYLEIEVENRGTAAMGGGTELTIAVEGRVADTLHVPGPGVYVSQARLQGAERHVALRFHPGGSGELSERNQWLARRVAVPDKGRGNLAVVDLREEGSLEILVRNEGTGTTSPDVWFARISIDGEEYSIVPFEIPDLAPGDEVWLDTRLGFPPGLHEVQLAPGTIANDADTTDDWRKEVLPAGPDLTDLRALLADPYLASAIEWRAPDGKVFDYWDWPWEMQERLEQFYVEIVEGRDPLGPRPFRDEGECLYSHWEALDVYLSHVAQSLWYELSQRSSYSLFDYAEEDLALLLGSQSLLRNDFDEETEDNTCFTAAQGAFPWSSFVAFGFLEGLALVDEDAEATIMNVADWARDNLDHGLTFPGAAELHYGSSYPRLEAMLYARAGDTNVSTGCGGTASLLHGVLRTVNIPVAQPILEYGSGLHVSVHFPTVGLHIVHGDDLYGTFGRTTYAWTETVPSEHVFMDEWEFFTRITSPSIECAGGTCNALGVQRQINGHRHRMQGLIDARATSLIGLFMSGDPAFDAVFEGTSAAVRPAFTESQRHQTELALQQRLEDWGDGDRDLGWERVAQVNQAMRRQFFMLRP